MVRDIPSVITDEAGIKAAEVEKEKKNILEVVSKSFYSLYNTCPAVRSAWSAESLLGGSLRPGP